MGNHEVFLPYSTQMGQNSIKWLGLYIVMSAYQREVVWGGYCFSADLVGVSIGIYPSLILVQPRKTRPFITERLLMGC